MKLNKLYLLRISSLVFSVMITIGCERNDRYRNLVDAHHQMALANGGLLTLEIAGKAASMTPEEIVSELVRNRSLNRKLDRWGNDYKITYNVGSFKFPVYEIRSAGPNGIFDDFDDLYIGRLDDGTRSSNLNFEQIRDDG